MDTPKPREGPKEPVQPTLLSVIPAHFQQRAPRAGDCALLDLSNNLCRRLLLLIASFLLLMLIASVFTSSFVSVPLSYDLPSCR